MPPANFVKVRHDPILCKEERILWDRIAGFLRNVDDPENIDLARYAAELFRAQHVDTVEYTG